ncbi:U5 small nuclear ribonucleoprotein 40 kDa protein [Caligus rogercresseyi]|uniref:U5 small nuclear ribonucleoprotein 40 kDa protein n=1 Tax=Caligus rogercresseyi TaxID=217165 RepID=A0A7T8KMD2_CALRO|nr:U5 small nuclear ribonucleoprotein 40 kDa protein [Caligus rogercresseyi]
MIEAHSGGMKRKPGPDNPVALFKKPRQDLVPSESHALKAKEGRDLFRQVPSQGNILASSGFDRQIYLWKVYGECENYGMITGHTGAILDLHFSGDGSTLYTGSTDKTVGIKRLKGHSGFVNSVHPARRGPPLLVSGSDDCTIKTWDQRKRGPTHSFNNTFQVTGVSYNDTADQIISGGIDNTSRYGTFGEHDDFYSFGHTDTITGCLCLLMVSYALTNSMDNSLRIWDMRQSIQWTQTQFRKNLLRCSWSPDGAMIAAGSADRFVYIWILLQDESSITSRHLGSVNEIDFHKLEPIGMF